MVKEVFWQLGLLSQKMLNPIVWLVVTRQKSSAIENKDMLNKRIFCFAGQDKFVLMFFMGAKNYANAEY